MGLNEQIKWLIRNVVDNNLKDAKEYAKLILTNETSNKNRYFCETMLNKLNNQSNFIELPYDLQNILYIEDLSNFNEKRYYLTKKEKMLYDNIEQVMNTNNKLSEMGLKYLNSTLLYGESGVGKTTFARYVAYKLKLPFAYINLSYCIDSHLGQTSKNISKIFDYIGKLKCVLLLDEIDAIGIKRGNEDTTGEMSRIVIGLMQSFDLIENDVVIIGATNRKDMVDEALARRFTINHEVNPLSPNETYNMVIQILEDLKVEYIINDIKTYSENTNKQSKIINDITLAIIKMLNDKNKFVTLANV